MLFSALISGSGNTNILWSRVFLNPTHFNGCLILTFPTAVVDAFKPRELALLTLFFMSFSETNPLTKSESSGTSVVDFLRRSDSASFLKIFSRGS